MKNIKLWYLYNSGFAIKLNNKFLIFDYYNDTPFGNMTGLDAGVITPNVLEGSQVYVFVSHAHYDHHNEIIYTWKNNDIDITYIISDDVKPINDKDIYYLKPNMDYNIKDLNITTLKSNDEGIAFYINLDDFYIFHSGDLNFWRWESESKQWNKDIENAYKSEISKLINLPIDIAFIPVDPRLENNYDLSLKYFIENIKPDNCTIVPMHFGDNYKVFDYLTRDGYMKNDDIITISKRGQSFII